MRTVRLVEGRSKWPYGRQAPGNDGVFGGTRFLIGPGDEPADWLVAMNDIPDEEVYRYPRERTLLFSGEPVSIKRFSGPYLSQFGGIWTVDHAVEHPNRVLRASPVPWHVGIKTREPLLWGRAKTYADFAAGAPPKTKLCSCVSSSLTVTEGHRRRLAFVEKLRAALGDQIDFYGRGFRNMADKDVALAPYRYHIAIENSVYADYWTEKLADTFLRNCFPIYSGATNIAGYFDPASFRSIDMNDPDAAIATIRALLASDTDRQAAAAVEASKQRVLNDYNILSIIDRYAADVEARGGPVSEARMILPESAFHPPAKIKYRKRLLKWARRTWRTWQGKPIPPRRAPV